MSKTGASGLSIVATPMDMSETTPVVLDMSLIVDKALEFSNAFDVEKGCSNKV